MSVCLSVCLSLSSNCMSVRLRVLQVEVLERLLAPLREEPPPGQAAFRRTQVSPHSVRV
jgi:hypothetical protein